MNLLRSQKNELYDLIINEGFSPSQFVFTEAGDSSFFRLTYKDSEYYFLAKLAGDTQLMTRISFCPARSIHVLKSNDWVSWPTTQKALTTWLNALKIEVDLPDKWAELISSSVNVKGIPEYTEHQKFSYSEVHEIEQALNQSKQNLSTIGLDIKQLEILNEKLDYISEKAKSLDKIDWKNLFAGTILSTIVQLSVPPDTSRAIWSAIEGAFKHIILPLLK